MRLRHPCQVLQRQPAQIAKEVTGHQAKDAKAAVATVGPRPSRAALMKRAELMKPAELMKRAAATPPCAQKTGAAVGTDVELERRQPQLKVRKPAKQGMDGRPIENLVKAARVAKGGLRGKVASRAKHARSAVRGARLRMPRVPQTMQQKRFQPPQPRQYRRWRNARPLLGPAATKKHLTQSKALRAVWLKLMVLRMQILQSVGAAAADVVDVVIG